MSESLVLDYESTTCPYCNADLRGPEIPEADRKVFGGATHFSRLIGRYDLEADSTVAYRCPDCGKEDRKVPY